MDMLKAGRAAPSAADIDKEELRIMKNVVKRILAVLMIASVIALGLSLAWADDAPVVRVASMKGPTSMGLVALIKSETPGQAYDFTVAGAADEIVPLIARDEIDIAFVPCNLASILYNNTGKIVVAGVNTLGVLYIVEKGDSIQSVEDLRGQTIVTTGKGTTPEYSLRHVLTLNGIDPDTDVTLVFKSEATEVLAALNSGAATVAMLPQPFATAALIQNGELREALSLTEMWDEVGETGSLVTGVIVVRKAFLEEHEDAVKLFLDEYAASVQYVNENPAEVAPWIEELDIAKAAIAQKALPKCNIVAITGEDMMDAVSGYLAALYSQDPASVGGSTPDEAFYYLGDAAEVENAG